MGLTPVLGCRRGWLGADWVVWLCNLLFTQGQMGVTETLRILLTIYLSTACIQNVPLFGVYGLCWPFLAEINTTLLKRFMPFSALQAVRALCNAPAADRVRGRCVACACVCALDMVCWPLQASSGRQPHKGHWGRAAEADLCMPHSGRYWNDYPGAHIHVRQMPQPIWRLETGISNCYIIEFNCFFVLLIFKFVMV